MQQEMGLPDEDIVVWFYITLVIHRVADNAGFRLWQTMTATIITILKMANALYLTFISIGPVRPAQKLTKIMTTITIDELL